MAFTEAKGRFGRAFEVTAVPRGANANPDASLVAVACVMRGPCVATGFGTNKAGHHVAMYGQVVRSLDGVIPVPAGQRSGGQHATVFPECGLLREDRAVHDGRLLCRSHWRRPR